MLIHFNGFVIDMPPGVKPINHFSYFCLMIPNI